MATLSLLALAVASPVTGSAGEWDLTGFAEVSSRTFGSDGRLDGQQSGSRGSFALQSEVYWQGSGSRLRFAAAGFGRLDSKDDERTHLDVREASVGLTGNDWDLNIGVNKVFWGVTEARHLVDIINQTDLVEDIDEEDKLGQPMINLNLNRDFGRIEIYVLTGFRERTFPGRDGRLRTPLPVDSDAAIFESGDGKRHRDVSLRYSQYFGDFDIGAYWFDGTSREPKLVPAADGVNLLPYYEQMRQVGVDLQLTRGAWLWKLEAIARETGIDRFRAAVTGIEYTFFGVTESGADIGVLAEYLYDGRGKTAPPTVFDDDLFIGTRIAMNDSSDTSLLAGTVIDLHTQEIFFNVEASRRIGERLLLDARIRGFGNARSGDTSYWLEADDYMEISLSWYFQR